MQQIEYYLEKLEIGKEDPQRPHDIMGAGNKFEWEVIKGFAVQYRDSSQEFFDKYVLPSLERHRCQYHHVKWNEPNLSASSADLKLGAVDAVCSLMEPRLYQGGKHSAGRIGEIIEQNPEHKKPWLRMIHQEMQKIKSVDILQIENLYDFPNLGISKNSYDVIRGRLEDTIRLLKR